MDSLFELLTILIPAALVVYGMYLAVTTLLQKQLDQRKLELKAKSFDKTKLFRLQSYERLALYLERISLIELVNRLEHPEMDTGTFRAVLVNEIRAELSHNYAQQIYVTQEIWEEIRNATEQTINLINSAYQNLKNEATLVDYKKEIFNIVAGLDIEPAQQALILLKKEVRDYLD
jgi:hypothetical protein